MSDPVAPQQVFLAIAALSRLFRQRQATAANSFGDLAKCKVLRPASKGRSITRH